MVYDVAIIGAGVVGTLIARQLSQFELRICLLEKEFDVALGSTKANSGIVHAGYDPVKNSLKARLNVRGNEMMAKLAQELEVPFRRSGSLVVAFDDEGRFKLKGLYENGIRNGVKGLQIITAEQARTMEPNLNPHIVAALYAPSAGIVGPYQLALGAAENAADNGVAVKLGTPITKLSVAPTGAFTLAFPGGELQCEYLINAAGIYADAVARLLGETDLALAPRKGEYLLLDKNQGAMVNTVIFQTPSAKGKGIMVTPTVEGNLLIGPNAQEVEDKEDKTTTAQGLAEVAQRALQSVPSLNLREVITSFAGLRATSTTGDFIIGAADQLPKLIQVAGIDSPGLTAAPAIAEHVVGLLADRGLVLKRKDEFGLVRRIPKRLRDLDEADLNRLIRDDPRYGNIICRCESVTEAEIVAWIHRPLGARDLDGVKRRTRAGMGRCQGGFCAPRVVEILARELKIPWPEVTKCGGNSKILAGKTK